MNVVVRNALSLFSSQLAVTAVSLVMLVVVPKYLGDVDFGRLSFAVTYVGLFLLVGSFGTRPFVVKAVARDPSLVGSYVYNGIVLKACMAIVLGALALGIGAVAEFDRDTTILVFTACVGMALFMMNEAVLGGLHGLQRMTRPALWMLVQAYVAAALGIGAVLLDVGVVGYAFATLPAAAVSLMGNSWALRHDIRRARRVDPALWWAMLAGGLPFLLMTAVTAVYGSIDMLMLRPLAGDAVVGWYALAYRWISLPVMLAATALAALFPALSKHQPEMSERFGRMANRALRFVCLVGFPAAAGIALVADDVIGLVYRGAFSESVPLMQILGLSIPLVVIDMVLGMVMMAADRQRVWLMMGLAAVVLNPALNLVVIPLTQDRYGNGAIGAALATVVTEVFMVAGVTHFRPRGVLDRATVVYIARCGAATAAMAAVVSGFGSLPLAGEIPVGIIAYAGAALLFGVVNRSELDWYRSQLRSRSTSSTDSGSDVSTASAPTPASSIVE